MKPATARMWFSDAIARGGGIGGKCVETGVYYWWHPPARIEVHAKTVKTRQGTDGRISIEVLESIAMVMTAYYVGLVMREDRPGQDGRGKRDYY